MSRGQAFKRLVRAYADEHGLSYTAARRVVLAQTPTIQRAPADAERAKTTT